VSIAGGVVSLEDPVRTAVSLAAPLLALTALSTYVVWRTDLEADWAGHVSLPTTAASLLASAWAILVAPSRRSQALAAVAFVVALATAVLWWDSISEILKTTHV
jgi:hypothetical protein